MLIDHRDTELDMTILQIDDMPKMLKEIGFGFQIKAAIICDPSFEDKFRFFQSVTYLASFNIRVFPDEITAMEWLISKTNYSKR